MAKRKLVSRAKPSRARIVSTNFPRFYILREDGGYLLREDGTRFKREKA